ncbi:MAG TPA: GNAT family N-acetyltransferase [Candidatus Acidoferrales bacterium]
MAETIRRAQLADKAELAKLRALLWPEINPTDNLAEIGHFFTASTSNALPTTVFVSQHDSGELTGFIEVGLRSHADGCDTARPVGFIEGWFVCESSRNQGIGKQLMRSAEDWARAHGCAEMASDALIDNLRSQRAHEAAGFEIVDRCVHFRKRLR